MGSAAKEFGAVCGGEGIIGGLFEEGELVAVGLEILSEGGDPVEGFFFLGGVGFGLCEGRVLVEGA